MGSGRIACLDAYEIRREQSKKIFLFFLKKYLTNPDFYDIITIEKRKRGHTKMTREDYRRLAELTQKRGKNEKGWTKEERNEWYKLMDKIVATDGAPIGSNYTKGHN